MGSPMENHQDDDDIEILELEKENSNYTAAVMGAAM